MRIVLLSLALLAAGCGGPRLAPVTGKVVMNGQPLTAGDIWLHPTEDNPWKGDKPSSLLQLDGSFAIRTHPHGAGAPPGAYKVTLGPALANRIGRPRLGKVEETPWSLMVPPTGVVGHQLVVD
jgi:hypothetical protein